MTDRTGPRQCLPNQQGSERTFNYLSHLAPRGKIFLFRVIFVASAHLFSREQSNKTRSSWLNCALRDDEAVHWVSIGYCEALAIGN